MSRSAWTWVLVFVVAVLVTWRAAQSEAAKDEEAQLYRLFVDALEHVDRSYVKEVDRRKLIESAIHGMLEELDPYSNFISEDHYNQFKRITDGSFGGVGIQVSPKKKADPYLEVISPLVGTPAYEAGILAGDRIYSVDGTPLEGLTQDDIIKRLTGQPNTSVKVTVQHKPYESEPFEVTLHRAEINIETVLGDKHGQDDSWDFLIDDDRKIGYIRISSFTKKTAADLRTALKSLEEDGASGLVIDLRNNPGGLLEAAVETCDLFLDEGVIVSTKGRITPERQLKASRGQMLKDIPIAVLINGASASASEIVAACLQDHERAVIVGERSFGKGSVQNVIELEDGHSALKLTTASYHGPSGKNIHKFPDSKESDDWGVLPDKGYEVKVSPEDQEKYFRWRAKRDRVFGKASEREKVLKEQEEKSQGEKKEDATSKNDVNDGDQPSSSDTEEFKDAQLEKALEYIRGKLDSLATRAA